MITTNVINSKNEFYVILKQNAEIENLINVK